MALFRKRRPAEPVDVVGRLIDRLRGSSSSTRTAAERELRRLRQEMSSDSVAVKRIAQALLEHQKGQGAARRAQRAAPPPPAATFSHRSARRQVVEFTYPHPEAGHLTKVKVTVSSEGEIVSAHGLLFHSFVCATCRGVWPTFEVPTQSLLEHEAVQRAIRDLRAAPHAASEEAEEVVKREHGRDVTLTMPCVACGYKTNVTVTIDWTGTILSGEATTHDFRCQNCSQIFTVSKEFLKEHTNRFV